MFFPVSFQPFGLQHFVTLGIILLLGAWIFLAGKHSRTEVCRWIGRALALVLFSYAAVIYIQKGIARELSLQYALPLELCHWVMIACVISLLRPSPFASEVAYFWGFAGTLQATLTPEIGEGFPSLEFIFFFWSHGAILLAIVFFVACQGFKPRPGSAWRMLLITNFYALLIGGLDALFGWNYGYLCRKPVEPSLLDFLGPWPWYLASLELVAFLSFTLLYLPWWFVGRRKAAV